MELEKAKHKRTVIKTATTKLLNKINRIVETETSDVELLELEECREQLKDKEKQLLDLNGKIEDLIQDLEILQTEVENNIEYRDKIVSTKFKLDKQCQKLKKKNEVNQVKNPDSLDSTKNENGGIKNQHFRLPKLAIQPYDGTMENWQEFWSLFENAIHNNETLTEVDKFTYLKGFLRGSALIAIQGLVISDKNYAAAIDILKGRFGKKELIIRAHLQKLMNLEPVKTSFQLKELRQLADVASVQIRSLQALGCTLDSFGSLLFPLLIKLIPDDIALDFNRTRKEDEEWDVNELLTFLKKEIENREKTFLFKKKYENTTKPQYGNQCDNKSFNFKPRYPYDKKNKQYTNYEKNNIPTTAAFTTALKYDCLFCGSNEHNSDDCEKFSIDERKIVLKKQGRCFRCMKKFHLASACRTQMQPCQICKSTRHSKSLCNNVNKTHDLISEKIPPNQTIVTSMSQGENINAKNEVILQTCLVDACTEFKTKRTFCLLDSGSERTFLSQALFKQLGLKSIRKEELLVYSFGSRTPAREIYNVASLKLKNIKNPNHSIEIEALVCPVICGTVLRVSNTEIATIKRKHDLNISDNLTTSRANIDVLIGIDYFYFINDCKPERISRNLFLSQTLLGVTVQGQINQKAGHRTAVFRVQLSDDTTLKNDLCFLWESEQDTSSNESDNAYLDTKIVNRFEKDLRFVDGRYESKLIWNSEKKDLGNNFAIARRRFLDLGQKIIADTWLWQNYNEIIKNQIEENIVENCLEKTENEYFMPHRPVIKQEKSSTQVRLVFNASSKEKNGNSLNECLLAGPNLNPNILTVILKFREFEVAVGADIEKAFLQIGIAREDRPFLKFLWFKSEENNKLWKVMQMTRCPFGVTCSPFILSATIKHHIRKFQELYPETCHVLNNSLYVDDLYHGAHTIEQALKLSMEAVKILKEAGMNLRKFTTNSDELRTLLVKNGIVNEYESEKCQKVLGIIWEPKADILQIDVKTILETLTNMKFTKRYVLKIAAKVFDPAGFIAPFVIRIKILMQEIWTLGLDWDDEIPQRIKEKFVSWCYEIREIQNIYIPRNYFVCQEKEKTLHIFCDSSPHAYGAVSYIRYMDKENTFHTAFVMSKARVAPLKKITLPRLELMGAVVGSRLANYLKTVFKIERENIELWTDSSIVFHWIRGEAKNWKPFVSNRVREIQEYTIPQNWKHCSSKDNPADLLTRGEKISFINENNLWWHGPVWLNKSENLWPQNKLNKVEYEGIMVERKSNIDETVQLCNLIRLESAILNIDNFGKIGKLYRITAWVLRFVYNCRKLVNKLSGELTASEIAEAEKYWIKMIQNEAFLKEMNDLRNKRRIDQQSSLYQLCPEFDDDELLCLKGRLQFSQFKEREKHPWILPRNKFSELIVMHAHKEIFHLGVDSTLNEVREKFWIIKGRQFVKGVLKKCLICRHYSARPGAQIVAPLPADRITESSPFSVTGLDFLGPVFTKGSREKHYVLLCTCAVTRAIHLEIVSNLSTEIFLLAFRRFISRRGICSTIYSDNAKTFKRADKELKEIWNVINDSKVKEFYAARGIRWKFIVERAAFWGGFWERMVKTVKSCLKKAIGKTSLSLEELETVLIEVEATINSRPLTYIYNDPQEPYPLSPAHFLLGKRLTSLPSIKLNEARISSNRDMMIRRYNYHEKLLQHFWKRWQREYMLNLRSANTVSPVKETGNFNINDVVLIHDERLPRNMWKLGKIVEVFPGRDGKIRACNVKTKGGNLKRPIQLLYPLEINEH